MSTNTSIVAKGIVGTRVTEHAEYGHVDNISSHASNDVGAVVRDWPIAWATFTTAFVI